MSIILGNYTTMWGRKEVILKTGKGLKAQFKMVVDILPGKNRIHAALYALAQGQFQILSV